MATDLDAFLDGSDGPDELDSFLDGDEGTMSESRLKGKRAAEWLADTPYVGAAASAASGALEGATFGFSDEIIGALGAMLGNGYGDTRDMVRQYNTTMGEKRPYTNLAGDLVSSIAVPGGLAKKAIQGVDKGRSAYRASRMAPEDKAFYDFINEPKDYDKLHGLVPDKIPYGSIPGGKPLDHMVDGMLAGAGAGGIRAAGENEDNSEIIGDIMQGGALGSVLGGVGGGVHAGGKAVRDALDGLTPPGEITIFKMISALQDTNPQLARTLTSMYDADPQAAAKIVSRLTGPKIDLPGMGIGAAKMASTAAVPVGRAMENPRVAAPFGSIMGAMSAEKLDSNDLFLDAEPRAGEIKAPTLTEYLAEPNKMLQRAQGTPYGEQLFDAMGEGPESFRARVFVLAQRPEFRRVMGLD